MSQLFIKTDQNEGIVERFQSPKKSPGFHHDQKPIFGVKSTYSPKRKKKQNAVGIMTHSDFIWIGLSAFISFLIALAITLTLYYSIPFFFSWLADLIREYDSIPQPAEHKPESKNKILPINNELNIDLFINDFQNKKPVLFKSKNSNAFRKAIETYFANDDLIIQVKDSLNSYYSMPLSQFRQIYRNSTLSQECSNDSPQPQCLTSSQSSQPNFISVSDPHISSQIPYLSSTFLPPTLPSASSSSSFIPLFQDLELSPLALTLTSNSSIQLSSTAFHSHTQSWSELIVGEKLWLFYKPSQFPRAGFVPSRPLSSWLEEVYPSVDADQQTLPYEIRQSPGEVVYVPEGWYHATLSLSSESLSFSRRSLDPEMNCHHYYFLEGEKKFNEGDFKSAGKFLRMGLGIERDFSLLLLLAQVLEAQSAASPSSSLSILTDSLRTYHQALSLNPRHPLPYARLLSLWLSGRGLALLSSSPKEALPSLLPDLIQACEAETHLEDSFSKSRLQELIDSEVRCLLGRAQDKGIRREVLKLVNEAQIESSSLED